MTQEEQWLISWKHRKKWVNGGMADSLSRLEMSGRMDIQIIQTHKHTCEYHTMHKNELKVSTLL